MPITTFGNYLRGARLGFRYSDKHEAFIRVIIVSDEAISVEVVPPDQLPRGGRQKIEYVCWWEGEDSEYALDLCEPLKGIRNPDKPLRFTVDDDGKPW